MIKSPPKHFNGTLSEYMSHLASKGKRKADTVESLVKRIQVVAENEGVEVSIKVRKR